MPYFKTISGSEKCNLSISLISVIFFHELVTDVVFKAKTIGSGANKLGALSGVATAESNGKPILFCTGTQSDLNHTFSFKKLFG